MYYIATARFSKEQDNGLLKSVSEFYLLDAASFTEAESTMYKFLEHTVQGGFVVKAIRDAQIMEVLQEEGSSPLYYYQAKVLYRTATDDSEKEKLVAINILVGADTIDYALAILRNYLSTMIVPYRVVGIKETKIIEVI